MATVKQKKALKSLVGNSGSVTQAMLDAGYSENTAHTPSKLTDSDGFQELMIQLGIDDSKLLNVLNDGLGATKVISAKIVGKNADESTDDFIDVPDFPTRHKYLETGLKLRGLVLEDRRGNITQININDPEVSDKMRSKFTEFLEAETLD